MQYQQKFVTGKQKRKKEIKESIHDEPTFSFATELE